MKRSTTYRFTVPNTPAGLAKIADLREAVRFENAVIRKQAWNAKVENVNPHRPLRMKVAVFGRLGKDNPNRDEYRLSGRYNAYQRIAIRHAATLDVYVNDVYTPWRFFTAAESYDMRGSRA
jgi:hypothetical protein